MQKRVSRLSLETLEARTVFDIGGLWGHTAALVADINTQPYEPYISHAELVGDDLRVLFEDGNGDVELWNLGNSADKPAFRDFEIDAQANCSKWTCSPNHFPPLHGANWIDGKLYFSFDRVLLDVEDLFTRGTTELWQSDGTQAGTAQIESANFPLIWYRDIGYISHNSPSFFQHEGSVFVHLRTSDDDASGSEFFALDAEGRNATSYDSRSVAFKTPVQTLVPFNGELYFVGIHFSQGPIAGLWANDPTSQQVRTVTTTTGDEIFGGPYDLHVADDSLYFRVVAPSGAHEVWTSDGTTSGSELLFTTDQFPSSSRIATFAKTEDAFLFELCSNSNCDMWEVDGSPEGANPIPTSDARSNLKGYWVKQPQGNFARELLDLPTDNLGGLAIQHNNLFPTANGGYFFTHENQTWMIAKDGQLQLLGEDMDLVNWFSDYSVFSKQEQLFVFDHGSQELVWRGAVGVSNQASDPQSFTSAGEHLYFLAEDQLLRMDQDGNVSPTGHSFSSAAPRQLEAVGNDLFVFATDGVFVLDTTTNEIERLRDGLATRDASPPAQVIAAEDGVYFLDASDNLLRLGFSDGSLAGTETVASLSTSPNRIQGSRADVTRLDENLVLIDGDHVVDLALGTIRPFDDFEFNQFLGPIELSNDWLPVGDDLYAIVENRRVRTLRRWDASLNDGVTLFTLPEIDTETSVVRRPRLFEIAGKIYFTDGSKRLFESDGTAEGTRLFKEFEAIGSTLEQHGDRIFFTADDGVHGHELWVTDGTLAGTELAADIRPGAGGSEPEELQVWNEQLVFSADDGETGREVWRIALQAIGDIDGNDAVDLMDFAILKQNFGQSTQAGLADGDLNNDGEVDFLDFLLFSKDFPSA